MYKYVLATMTLLILFKAISADPVKAAEEPTQKELHMRIEQHFRQKAERLGIETDGKELKQVRKELHYVQEEKRKQKVQEQAMRYRVPMDGKEIKEVILEIRAAKEKELQEAAEKAGISIEGKTAVQLVAELEQKTKK